MQRNFTAGLIALAFSLTMLAPLASAHVENNHEYWFSSDTGAATDHTMYYNDTDNDGFDVTIANGDFRVWEANDPAITAFPLGGNGQVFTLTLLIKQGANLVTDLGVVRPDGSFDPCETATVNQGVAGPVLLPAPVQPITARNVNVVFTPDATCTTNEGDRIGVRVTATGNTVILGTGDVTVPILSPKERTHLHMNFAPPSVVVPELSTLLLAGVGLAGVALVVARRK